MKIVSVALSSLTILMALSQLICGLWLKSQGAQPSDVSFHVELGIGTVSVAVITIIVLLFYVIKH
jgi:hypothetical protein